MATFTLSDLKNEVSKKYAPTEIENGKDTYVLQNLLQLPKEKRDEVMGLIDKVDSEEEEESSLDASVATFRSIIESVEANGKGKELLELLGDNTALIIEVASRWMETTQLGEAEHS